MKKLWNVLILALALNFLALAGGTGWLFHSGRLDKAKVAQLKAIVFAPLASTTQPGDNAPTTQPALRLEDLMAQEAGRPASEQVDFIQQKFDEQMLEMDRRQRELTDLKRQVDLANLKLAADREELDKEKQALAQRVQEADKLQTDKGFQDSLALYQAMPSKQVKTIFMTLSEETVERYLDAMEPRAAAKIIKEFNAPAETVFIQKVLERMRQAQASSSDEKQP